MENSQNTTTVRLIAEACRVSKTTVALALKNSPLVAAKTRVRIQAKADIMGYKLDANLSKLMGHLSKRRQRRSLCNLGWLNCTAHENEWRSVSWQKGLLHGARKRAEELGYAIDEIWVREPNFRPQRLPSLLKARGIEGLLIPPLIDEIPEVAKCLNWEELHSVLLFEPYEQPKLNRVDNDHNFNMQLAFREILKLGYRRPALVTCEYHDWRSSFSYSGQFRAEHRHLMPRESVLPFWRDTGWSHASFLKWFKAEKPDVLLVTHNEWLGELRDMGIRVPEDVGLVHLFRGEDVRDWAGIDPRRELAGSSAVDLLTAHLARDEKGLPPYVKQMLIQGEWQAGCTVRASPSLPTKRKVKAKGR